MSEIVKLTQQIIPMNARNKKRVAQFLCQPQGGKTYLLNALNSKSEQTFIKALHNIIDAMNQDLTSNSL